MITENMHMKSARDITKIYHAMDDGVNLAKWLVLTIYTLFSANPAGFLSETDHGSCISG